MYRLSRFWKKSMANLRATASVKWHSLDMFFFSRKILLVTSSNNNSRYKQLFDHRIYKKYIKIFSFPTVFETWHTPGFF